MATTASIEEQSGLDLRARIVSAAIRLLADDGKDALTTRAVSAAASVQAPTIYRLFGDKEGLLDAVAEQILADFVAKKARNSTADADPVESLRKGFIGYVSFGLDNPDVFLLMHAQPGRPSKASDDGIALLRQRVKRIALAGRLAVSEQTAVELCHNMAVGTVLGMLGRPETKRAGMAEAARDAVMASILNDVPRADSAMDSAVSTLRAHLDQLTQLTEAEKQLLQEWLKRLSNCR